MTNMLHRVLWGRGYAEPQQIPLAIAGEEADVMAVSGGGSCFIVSAGDMDV